MSTDRKSIAQIKKEFAEAKEGSLEELFAYNSVKSTKGNRHVHKKMDSGAERTVRCSQFDSRLRTSYERIPK